MVSIHACHVWDPVSITGDRELLLFFYNLILNYIFIYSLVELINFLFII